MANQFNSIQLNSIELNINPIHHSFNVYRKLRKIEKIEKIVKNFANKTSITTQMTTDSINPRKKIKLFLFYTKLS